jgi:ribonuclease BN (tRNA processing enzyme)
MARLGLPWQGLTHLLVTHFHMDHVGELAYLLFAMKHGLDSPRETELTVLGPKGLFDHLDGLARTHGAHILDPGFPLEIHELSPGQSWAGPRSDFGIATLGTPHTGNSLAVRVETDDGLLGFTGDTGPEPALGPFFQGCHILLAECSHPNGREMDTHLTPGGLAALATVAAPQVLVTLHCYPPLDPDEVPSLLLKAGFDGLVLTGWDGLRLDLRDGVVKFPGTPMD